MMSMISIIYQPAATELQPNVYVSKIGCKAAASPNVVLNVCSVTFTAQLLSTNYC